VSLSIPYLKHSLRPPLKEAIYKFSFSAAKPIEFIPFGV
jgi:hypothetical protein